ncbi:MAG TPA: hypothetical protein VNW97_22565 [Candidatus Saccharimonadales bacterium]|jgi:hypothetical protein|nr:hypothetical protein [Candidatus Saccharimonadales bacterium]
MKLQSMVVAVWLLAGLVAAVHAQDKLKQTPAAESRNIKTLPGPVGGCPGAVVQGLPVKELQKPDPQSNAPQACRKAVVPRCVNLCDLAVQMLPQEKQGRQMTFLTLKHKREISVPGHVDLRLSVPKGEEVVWYCKFSRPRPVAEKKAIFNFTPGESLSFAIIDIEEVEAESHEHDRKLETPENPFCTDFLDHPQTGELHSGVPRNGAVGHTYKYSFVIGAGRFYPPVPANPATRPPTPAIPPHFSERNSHVDPHLIVTGGGGS